MLRFVVGSIALLQMAGCALPAVPAVDPPRPPPLAIEMASEVGPALLLPVEAPEPPRPSALLAITEAIVPPDAPPGPRSERLPSGFFNPMPGGVMAGYQADTGLDIAGSPRPVYALAAGTLDYSEPGHTLWTGPSDTANCVRFALDTPIGWKGRRITHVYYAHLSRLDRLQHEGEGARRHVEGGERLGFSGVARHSPHLHIGLLLDGEVEQTWGSFLLADEVRLVLGGYKNGDRLPRGAEGEP
ncbi:MAG: hypothetical protein U0359_31225 [Byssovorax sp.]